MRRVILLSLLLVALSLLIPWLAVTLARRWSGFPARPVRAGVGQRRARRRNAHHGAVR